jgi:hypothetical protein
VARLAGHGVAGKLVSLGAWLLEDGELLEADLQQFYGVSLLDLSIRRAWVLVTGLPPEARWVRKHEPRVEWSNETYLLAVVADLLANLQWTYVAAHTPKGRRPPPAPKPIPRPGQPRRKEPEGDLISGEQLESFLSS